MNILWIGQVLEDYEILRYKEVSAAANSWQKGLIVGLTQCGLGITLLGHVPNSFFPRGNLFIRGRDVDYDKGITGFRLSYINFPLFRTPYLMVAYTISAIFLFLKKGGFDCVITYNNYRWSRVTALVIKRLFNKPWLSVVADDLAPNGPSGYVFLSHYYYMRFVTTRPKMHLDGGVNFADVIANRRSKVPDLYVNAIYCGTISAASGTDLIFLAASESNCSDVRFSVYGRCSQINRDRITRKFGPRALEILQGFHGEDSLREALMEADVLLNPRSTDHPENDNNFPSKLYYYATFPIPIVSSKTPGISPEWDDILFYSNHQSVCELNGIIMKLVRLDATAYEKWNERRIRFLGDRTWLKQAERIKKFLVCLRVSNL